MKTCKGKPGACGRTYTSKSTLWQCPYCHCTLSDTELRIADAFTPPDPFSRKV